MPSPITNQANCAGNSTAVPLSATIINCAAYSIKAPQSNTSPVWIGDSTVTSTTGYQLDPGDELAYERVEQHGTPIYNLRPEQFYVCGPTGNKVTWLASP